jgi:hypothetical protein
MAREIRGCMNCGSPNLDFLPVASEAYIGTVVLTDNALCRNCDFYGIPLIFKGEKMRQAYENAKRKRTMPKKYAKPKKAKSK